MSAVMKQLYADLTDDLNRIASRFKNPKLSLIVRNPDLMDGDVLIGNDDLEEAITAARRLQAKVQMDEPK